ncbi:DEAD/DEAH box helicase [Proteiniborus sp. MB09-C3]|uniref:DEAD/DEAH box helicase n=1 Tax=Proteiniborus sp. MB09-C3 TaxID=3050072 RepID=UPI0025540558|nr:DEAD/DEAH box helicase [Proteiniborus sp. MB09-C3]WIV11458.1 DEAD/DEAH box helicase [Proteiniborus sp. MB09-C3]
MFNITEELIKTLCPLRTTHLKGQQYYRTNKVREITFNSQKILFNAVVSGNKRYNVKVEFNDEGNFHRGSCTCPAYDEYWGYCKHIVATLYEIRERDQKGEYDKVKSYGIAKNILDFFRYKQLDVKSPVQLEITYEFEPNPYGDMDNSSYISLRIGENKLYVVKSIKKLLESLESKEELQFGKEFTFDPKIHRFNEMDQPIINLLQEIYDTEKVINENVYGFGKTSLFKGKRVNFTSITTKRFFEIMKNRSFKSIIMNRKYENVKILEENIPLKFKLDKLEKDLVLNVDYGKVLIPLVTDGEYFFRQDSIYKTSKQQREYFVPFYAALIKQRNNSINIPQEYNDNFVSEVYPFIEKIGDIEIDSKVQSLIYKPEINPEVYLDTNEDAILADLRYIYGDIVINPFTHEEKKAKEDRILIRDFEREKEIVSIFETSEFKVKNNQIYLDDEEKKFEFVFRKIPLLQEKAEVFYSEAFKNVKIKDISSFSGGVRLNSENDMLEFSFDISGINRAELMEVFNSLREKKKYYKLKDGSYLPLEMNELKSMSEIIDYLELDNKDFEKDIMQIPKFKALYLDEKLKQSENNYIKRNLLFKELVQNIKEPGDIDYTIPEKLKKILRDYQRFGFKWLKTLAAYGMGGILADDMGLGKTLQVLTFILSEKMEGNRLPNLIVAPTSLVYNWAAEVEKFTPELSTLVISGSKDERQNNIEDIMNYDIVVTSYPLIRRDIELYENIKFKYCILDEAQHIKNPMSQNAKSVKDIKAHNYFALTGTPIENSLTELWSIFDYIMPGYLLSHSKFTKKFERPIIKENDKKSLEELSKYIRPFILRRLKKEVLKELPDKIEHKLVAELTTEQKKIYIAYLNQIKGEIEDEIKDKGFERSHIKILAGLTRLRQICCHPSLFIEGFNGESGKLQLLEELISDILDGGHRILLFSQFTSMLKIISHMLEKKEIGYLYLDGSTDTMERGQLVDSFNKGKGQIFLISLKAGGTGLNLTGADTVIHFDPWWNPAVEEQATDRAHRIGQESVVHVMKLITQGTIEDKIFKLQERKKELIDSVIQPGETLVSKMSEEDIRDLFEI